MNRFAYRSVFLLLAFFLLFSSFRPTLAWNCVAEETEAEEAAVCEEEGIVMQELLGIALLSIVLLIASQVDSGSGSAYAFALLFLLLFLLIGSAKY